ncbi:MAG TPA: amidohydrolase family protein [Candidatus Polarisedimenticolia bacterium]|nr:amidohydrolase family protein [Candidatus Polarisedimenticolia bacterium]
MRRFVPFLLPACLVLLAPSPAGAADDEGKDHRLVVIKAARLIDGVSDRPLRDAVIVIDNDRITEVGAGLPVPDGAEVIDLGAATVLPGLIDCHTHITAQSEDYYGDRFRKSPIDRAVMAHVYARRTLEAGFTTIRDVGASEFIDVALRDAIDRGDVVGPRMQAATLGVGATGGHGDLVGFSPWLRFESFSRIADGVDEIRKLIRFEIKHGADLIKLIATAGVLSEEESVGAPQYSFEEMKAAVDEAAMWGRKVAAHAHGTEGIKRAVRAGVASIEHGSLLDDEAIRMMKERGTYLVADVYNDDYILAEFARKGYPEATLEKERSIGLQQRESFRRAVAAGLNIAYGTDAAVYPHGWNGRQFAHMVRWGMTPMQAIKAATVNAADLLGWSDDVGALRAGLYADLIAVAGDPLQDVGEFDRVGFVMKGGVVYKNVLPPR